MGLALCAGFAQAQQVNNLNEQGSLLVFPLIDNTQGKSTIIEVTNRGNLGVWLQGFMIVRKPGDKECDFVKKDFYLHLTAQEPLYWNTSGPYNRRDADGVLSQVQSFAGYEGFCFVWAIDSNLTKDEIEWNFLKGDGLLIDGARAMQYNAIPHQGLDVVGNRVLNLNGREYTAAPSQIMVEGFAVGVVDGGYLAIASLCIDFVESIQPEMDINIDVWNQEEVGQSRHVDFCQWKKYDLDADLQVGIEDIFTAKYQLATTATGPIWAVFYQYLGSYGAGGNVWQHPRSGEACTVVLPPVPRLVK
jgi:hypothetical protein